MRCVAELMLLKKTTHEKQAYLDSMPEILAKFPWDMIVRGEKGLVANHEELARRRASRKRRDTKTEDGPKIRD